VADDIKFDPDVFAPTDGGEVVDFTSMVAAEEATVPSGNYVMRVTALDWGKTGENSKNPGALKLTATFEVAAGPHQGAILKRIYTFSEAALPSLFSLCAASGKFTDDELAGKVKRAELHRKLTGAVIVAPVKQKADELSDRADGMRSEIGFRVFSLKSPRGQRAAEEAGYDPLAP